MEQCYNEIPAESILSSEAHSEGEKEDEILVVQSITSRITKALNNLCYAEWPSMSI